MLPRQKSSARLAPVRLGPLPSRRGQEIQLPPWPLRFSRGLYLLAITNRGATEIADGAADQASAHHCSERCAGYRCDARAQRRATYAGLLGSAQAVASARQAPRGKD